MNRRPLEKRLRLVAGAIVCLVSLLAGCDTVTRHKVLTTIFDGVPSLPPPDKYCQEYAENREAQSALSEKEAASKERVGSTHRPYGEKKCDDCHAKEKEGGFVVPKEQLCYHCHKDFIKGRFVHGPVAAAACLACHDPHSSGHPSLLKAVNVQLCNICHREDRVAATMHDRLVERRFDCIECHDPHSGNSQYFLK